MSQERVVLVTGVAGYWGARVAARLEAEGAVHVIGLDAQQPAGGRNSLDFILADVRNPLLAELLKVERVDTVCHLAFTHSTWRSESTFEARPVCARWYS
jgi:UDP-glucose 4-epimerase